MGIENVISVAVDNSSESFPRLAVYVAILGWVLPGLYILLTYFEYTDFTSLSADMFSSSYVGIRLRSLVLAAPLLSMTLGYVIYDRSRHFAKLTRTEKQLEQSYAELSTLHNGLIFAFAQALDAKSQWTKGHSERVTEYSLMIAREMDLDDEQIEMLRTAALLHDIGKIGIPDSVLNSSGKLMPEDIMLIRRHAARGDEILRSISRFDNVRDIIRHHHEHVNGAGYPDRLKGNRIPLLSKIICVADAFDAMTADRPYRIAPGREYAISELQNCSGLQFDHKVVQAFLRTGELRTIAGAV